MADFIREVKIYKGTTSIRLRIMNNLNVCDFPICSLYRFLMNNLVEFDWDARLKKRTITYTYYTTDKNSYIRLPVQFLSDLENYLKLARVAYDIIDIVPQEPTPINVNVVGGFIPRDGQSEFINFLVDPNDYKPMKAIQLGCGGGKTAIGLNAIVELGYRTMIVAPPSLNDQWVERIEQFIPDAKTYVISGHKSILSIIENNYEIDADILMCSIKTLAQYAARDSVYEDFPSLEEFTNKLGIGVKISDEAHLSFHAMTMIDMFMNVKHNFYLSATYSRGKRDSMRIFAKTYPDSIRLMDGDKMDHINTTNIVYYFTSWDINPKATGTSRGYSQFKYEQYLLKNPDFIDRFISKVLLRVIDEYFMEKKSKGQKLLILVGLKQLAYTLEARLAKIYPSEVVRAFLAEHSEDVLKEATVIISTPGSMGVGKDVKGLRTLISIVSVVSEAESLQHPGRLRKMENGDVPEYVYLTNSRVAQHDRHREIKEKLYKPRSKTFSIRHL